MRDLHNEKTRKELRACIEDIAVVECPGHVEICYILPQRCAKLKELGVRQIDFAKFRECVQDKGVIGRRFAESLDRWVKEAGECLPRR